MKIVVISDSHANIANLNHVLGFAKKIKAGAIIHCGDWDNVGAIEIVLSSKIPLFSVLGNADIDASITKNLKLRSKNFSEKFLQIEIDGRKIGVIHSLRQLDSLAARHLDILFTGHTHKQEETAISGVKVVNPGALENNISFAVYDTETNNVDLVKI